MDKQTVQLKSIVEWAEANIHCCRQAIAALEDGREDETLALVQRIKEGTLYGQENLALLAKILCPLSHQGVICENILGSIDHFARFWETENKERALMVLKYEIMALVRDLKEDLYFWHFVYPDEQRMKDYYRHDFVPNHRNEYVADGFKHQVSIVVQAYNKLEYTKQCIEYLFKKTDFAALDCELITINNGSRDETEAFFESLPHKKKINFVRNTMSSVGMAMLTGAEGRYLVYLPNDVLVTDHWLENLLACIKSDPKIITVVPVTNYMSNLQTIETHYKTIPQMEKFAKKYNQRDPLKWEDRSRLLPTMGLYSAEKLNHIGFTDRYFYYGEFGDDDFCLRSRRAGYRQVLCKDTFVHHFGSVTTGEAQRKQNSLGISRELFHKKHGLDAWSHDFCYNPLIMDYCRFEKKGRVNILGVDSGFGSTPLQIKNLFRQRGNREAVVYNFTVDQRFAPDLESPVSDFFQLGENIYDLEHAFAGVEFDFVYLHELLENYEDGFKLLDIIAHRLGKSGQLIFTGSNYNSLETILNVFTFREITENGNLRFYEMQKILKKLEEHFQNLKFVRCGDPHSSLTENYLPGNKKDDFLALCFELLKIKVSKEYQDLLKCEKYLMFATKK